MISRYKGINTDYYLVIIYTLRIIVVTRKQLVFYIIIFVSSVVLRTNWSRFCFLIIGAQLQKFSRSRSVLTARVVEFLKRSTNNVAIRRFLNRTTILQF